MSGLEQHKRKSWTGLNSPKEKKFLRYRNSDCISGLKSPQAAGVLWKEQNPFSNTSL